MSDVKFRYTGDNAEALKAVEQLQKKVAQLEAANDKLNQSSKKGSADNAQASREAKRLLASLVSEQERHNKRVEELTRLLKAKKISQNQYAAAVAKSAKEVDRAEKSGDKAFGSGAIAQIKSMASAIAGGAGLAAAWKLVADEINAANEAQARAGEESLTVADAQAGALRNLGATNVADRDAFIADIKKIADELHVEEKGLYLLASDALSARGNLSIEQAMESVRLGAEVAPDDATGTGKAFAGASLDVAKLSGATAEQSAGFLMNVGQMARVTDTGRLAKNVTPALTAATAHEASLPTAGATFAALTGGMGDPSGEQAKTAMIKFSGALDEFLPEVGSMRERIAMLQQDEGLRGEFLDKHSFEAAAAAPIEQLVSGKGATAEAYADFSSRMPDVQESGEFFGQWLQVFQSTSLQQTAAISRAGDRMTEGLRTADQEGARAGIMTADLKEKLIDAGMPALGAKLDTFGASVSDDQVEKVLELFETRQHQLERGRKVIGSGPSGSWSPSGGSQEVEYHDPTDTELKKAKVLEAYVTGVRDIRARANVADPGSSALEQKTDQQTAAVVEAIREQTEETRMLREDMKQTTPATPPPRPMPSNNTAAANRRE